jgi:hypothetical protein
MPGPMPLRTFRKLVKHPGCKIDRTASEWKVVDSSGRTVITFAVTHGKRTKGNEVLPVYVKLFLNAVEGR